MLYFPWDQYLLTSLYSSATWRCSFPEPCGACFTINPAVALSAYSSACWLAQRFTGASSKCKCKPLGRVRDCTEIIVFLVCWSLAIVVLRSGGVSGGSNLQGVCKNPWCRVLLHARAVACGFLCFMVSSGGGHGILGLYFFSDSSKISHLCLCGKKIPLPYSLTVLESRLCSSCCKRS